MYDKLKIDPRLLPVSEAEKERLSQSCRGGFQIKSLHKMLYLVEIAADGRLRWSDPDRLADWEDVIEQDDSDLTTDSETDQSESNQSDTGMEWTDEPDYTGEIRFHDSINGILYEFCALYALGQLLRIVKTRP